VTAAQGIPTKFNGTQFRSRLEARWAAFFELIQWPYIYEPFDADGYIPDFVIRKPGYKPLLIEVKHAVTDREYSDEFIRIYPLIANHWKHPILILGAAPHHHGINDQPTVGLYVDQEIDRMAYAIWWMRERNSTDVYLKPTFTSPIVTGDNYITRTEIDTVWKQAGNCVQWKSPAQKPMSTAERTQARIRRAQEKRDSS
jgi:hypothetical protein